MTAVFYIGKPRTIISNNVIYPTNTLHAEPLQEPV